MHLNSHGITKETHWPQSSPPLMGWFFLIQANFLNIWRGRNAARVGFVRWITIRR